jgi:hypothetical protein
MKKRTLDSQIQGISASKLQLGVGLALALSGGLTGCQMTDSKVGAIEGVLSAFEGGASKENLGSGHEAPQGAGQDHEGCVPGNSQPREVKACRTEVFHQPEAELNRRLDLLFVADTSASLVDERREIARGIDGFVGALPASTDLRVSVMLAHSSRSAWSGALYRVGGVGPVLDSNQLGMERLRSGVETLLTRAVGDYAGDGGEEMLFSLNRGLSQAALSVARAQGFFRVDAALAVIFITDENDICATFPAGVSRVRDFDGLEAPAFRRDCAGISPVSVLDRLKAVQEGRPLFVGGVGYVHSETVPAFGENELAYGILETVEAAQGEMIDLGADEEDRFQSGLERIGSLVSRQVALQTEFQLTGLNGDSESHGLGRSGLRRGHEDGSRGRGDRDDHDEDQSCVGHSDDHDDEEGEDSSHESAEHDDQDHQDQDDGILSGDDRGHGNGQGDGNLGDHDSEFKLEGMPIDRESIRVFVDGREVAFEIDIEKGIVRIALEDAGDAESEVKIEYCSEPHLVREIPCGEPSVSPSTEPSVSPSPSATPSAQPSTCTGLGCMGGVIGI